MSNEGKSLSSGAEVLLSNMRDGLVLWFSDAGEYPDRFWLESAGGEAEQTGQVVGIKVVTELQQQRLIEPDSGDSYRQCWRLVSQDD